MLASNLARPIYQSSQWLQQGAPALVNRGILDSLGFAIPMIGLARSPQEQKELTLDRILVIGSAFFLAPAHAWVFKKLGAKVRKIPSTLLELNWKRHGKILNGEYLKDGQHLLDGIQKKLTQLQSSHQKTNSLKQKKRFRTKINELKPLLSLSKEKAETLRIKLINAKMDLLIPDLMTECLIFGNIGFITNAFSKWLYGNQQFTGEQGIVSAEALRALYQEKKESELGGLSQKTRQRITTGLSLLLPLSIGLTLKRSLKKLNPNKFWRNVQKLAYKFDYENGQWMSMAALSVVVALQEIGQLMASRSKREFKEGFIRETVANVLFFVGNDFFAIGLARGLKRLFKTPVSHRLAKLPDNSTQKSKNLSAYSYFGGFLTNVAALAGVIIGNNALTTHHLKQDAQEYYLKLSKHLKRGGLNFIYDQGAHLKNSRPNPSVFQPTTNYLDYQNID